MNKIKLLLLGLITVFTLSISNTYAVTFKGDSNSAKIISGYNNFSYQDYTNGFYGCIWENYKTNANLQRESSGCSDGYYTVRGHYSSYGALRINDSPKSSYGGYKLRNKQGSPDIFALPKYRNGEETIYRKITMKNLATKMLSVKSQRGENVYDEAFVDGIGFVALVKDQNQVRAAHVITNSYILDGYLLAISQFDSYILDTYANKIYKYNNNFYSSEMQREGVAQIFPKLWNTVPDQVSDVVRGLPSRNKVTVNSQDLSFDFSNTQTGTKATLAELRENIKKSITILDQEGAEFFLGETPESYGIGAGSPNTDNQLNTSGSNTSHQVQNSGAEEKKACVEYYTRMKMFTSVSASCRGESREGEEKYEYWENVLFGMYEQYNLWDKFRYPNCHSFGIIKEKWIKSYGKDRFDAFQRDWETKYLYSKSEDVDINAMCSHIQLTSLEKLQEVKDNQPWYDKFFRSLGFLGAGSGRPLGVDGSGNALYQGDFQEELKSLQPYYWQCQGYDKYGLTKITQTEDQKTKACNLYNKYKTQLLDKWKGVELEYTNDSTAEGQIRMQEQRLGKGNGMLESVSSGVSNTLSEGGEVLLKVVKNPFNSGYNAILPLQCGNKQNFPIMNYVLLGVFSFLIFIFLKAM